MFNLVSQHSFILSMCKNQKSFKWAQPVCSSGWKFLKEHHHQRVKNIQTKIQSKKVELLFHTVTYHLHQRTLTMGEVSLYGRPPFDWFGFNQASKTVVPST